MSEGGGVGVACGRPARRRLTLAPEVNADGQRSRRFGGRSWALTDELSESSDEEVLVVSPVPEVEGVLGGQSSVTACRREVPAVFGAASRSVVLSPCARGISPARDSREVVGPAACSGTARKQWRGPLPPRRVLAKLTLGDCLLKASWRQPGRETSAIADSRPSSSLASGTAAPPSASMVGDSNFESRRQDPVSRVVGRLIGKAPSWAFAGANNTRKVVSVGRSAQFKINQGIVSLFCRAGRLCSRVSRCNASCPTSPSRERDRPVRQAMQGGGSSGAGAGGRSSRWEQQRPAQGAAYGGRTGAAMGPGNGGHGCGAVQGNRDRHQEEGEFNVGEGFHVDHSGFNPGSDGQAVHWNRGGGWPRRPSRARGPRGPRSFGARRGGLQGRGGRLDAMPPPGAGAVRGPGRAPVLVAGGGVHTGALPPARTRSPAAVPAMDGFNADEDDLLGEEEDRQQPRGRGCGRCAAKNHATAECVTHLYCDICDAHDEHMNHRCPVLKMPKPVAHAVGFAVEGLGFYHIPHPPLSKKRDAKTALIKVVRGSLSSEQLVSQLQKVVPGKWKWQPVEQPDGSFVVEFPSKVQLRTSINYGSMDIRENGVSTGVRLEFEEWHDKDEGFLLPKVWVRVSGIRKALREYLNLWAVGSILGSTQVVDMKTTRKNDFGRICVAVLDPKLLPKELDVVIGDRYFELKFVIEKKGVDENGDEIEWDFAGGNGNDPGMEEDPSGNEKSPTRESKHSRNEDTYMEDGEMRDRSNTEAPHDLPPHPNPAVEEKIQAMAKDILDRACDKVFDECVDRVMGEQEDDQLETEFLEADNCFAGNMLVDSLASPMVVDAAMRHLAKAAQCRVLPVPLGQGGSA